eukprot:5320618-Amphidinium_carterae.1
MSEHASSAERASTSRRLRRDAKREHKDFSRMDLIVLVQAYVTPYDKAFDENTETIQTLTSANERLQVSNRNLIEENDQLHGEYHDVVTDQICDSLKRRVQSLTAQTHEQQARITMLEGALEEAPGALERRLETLQHTIINREVTHT